MEEHWQKLILCLAVLLIVVSSTVGAHLLLGDRLWSPLGKCSLAMVATLLFAALGMGLIRWGAERAGQMMLVTTLILVPIHFMVDGELKLLLEPSAWRIGGFGVQVACLFALSRSVGGVLLPRPAGHSSLETTATDGRAAPCAPHPPFGHLLPGGEKGTSIGSADRAWRGGGNKRSPSPQWQRFLGVE